jgi:hypothetical protein
MTTHDWIAVALVDLRQERGYLEAYGAEGYLPRSIKLREELDSTRDDGGLSETEIVKLTSLLVCCISGQHKRRHRCPLASKLLYNST